MRRRYLFALSALTLFVGMAAQSANVENIAPSRSYALTNARLVIRPGVVVDNGTVVLRDDVIVAAGKAVKIPSQARVLDLAGRTVFAGFIDPNSSYAMPVSTAPFNPKVTGLEHPSTQIHADLDVTQQLRPDTEAAANLRKLGFTSVAAQPPKGIFRGQTAVLSTADADQLSEVLIAARVAQLLAFDTNPPDSEHYPQFQAGSSALMRQTFLDAQWYRSYDAWRAHHRDATPLPLRPDLDALGQVLARQQPVFVKTEDEFDFNRAWHMAQEFGLDWVLIGNGNEYRYARTFKQQGARIIVPLTWPKAPRIGNDDDALEYSLQMLEQWEWAGYNARVLVEAGVPVAFTAAGLQDTAKEFWPRLRKAVALGLDEQAALAALTEVPASMLGLSDRLGTLQPGRRAQLVVADADLFRSDRARIYETWVDGQRYVLETSAPTAREQTVSLPKPALPGVLRYPGGEFGRTSAPEQPRAVLVRGATVWTQGSQGILQDADLLVERGRIRAVGQRLNAPADAVLIDGHGLHLTPGLIDAHSHMALNRGRSYGEHSDRITGEVRNSDILKPTDIAIYQQLADGVTSALLLHGAGNPITGQSETIKLRWGSDAEGLKFAGAGLGMKLGLGESPKQATWGRKERYPLTRMGVHESLREAFEQARAYVAAREQGKAGAPQRRDLRLEAVAQLISGERTMHVHSYRQSELLAFMRLCREYGVAPVFHHIAEGYKVADEMAAMGAGASAFVDYWGMKWETDEATVYNPALMVRQGVLVSIGSDVTGPSGDGSGPRLNLDAALTVRFGGLTPSEALGLVTLNPAKQMRIADRVGSLESGKDADFVLWNDDPLSPRAKVLQTWVDGRRYFDREEHAHERARIDSERARLIALARQRSAEEAR